MGLGFAKFFKPISINTEIPTDKMMRAFQQIDKHYTVEDYMQWSDDIRCELIDGVVYDMSPAPIIKHQSVSGNLFAEISFHLREIENLGDDGEPPDCRVFAAPIDVVLNYNAVVQPDIIIVCGEQKLANGKYVDGAPDAVVEILSPSTNLKDRREKKALFERSGVQEYLLIDPAAEYAEYYVLTENKRYGLPVLLGPDEQVKFACLPGFELRLAKVFQ